MKTVALLDNRTSVISLATSLSVSLSLSLLLFYFSCCSLFLLHFALLAGCPTVSEPILNVCVCVRVQVGSQAYSSCIADAGYVTVNGYAHTVTGPRRRRRRFET